MHAIIHRESLLVGMEAVFCIENQLQASALHDMNLHQCTILLKIIGQIINT